MNVFVFLAVFTLTLLVIVSITYVLIRLWPILRFVFWPAAMLWLSFGLAGTSDFIRVSSGSAREFVIWALILLGPSIVLLSMELLRQLWLKYRTAQLVAGPAR